MVVKIGSSTVVGADGKVNRAFIGGLADQAAALRELGWRLVVVSSGALPAAIPCWASTVSRSVTCRPAGLRLGRSVHHLSAYDEEFHARDLLTSLVLLTRHDTARRTSYLHARDACCALWSWVWCRSSTRTIPSPSMRSSLATTTRWRRL